MADNFRACYYASKPSRQRRIPTTPATTPEEAGERRWGIGKWSRDTGEYIGPCIARSRPLIFHSKRAAEAKAEEFNQLARMLHYIPAEIE